MPGVSTACKLGGRSPTKDLDRKFGVTVARLKLCLILLVFGDGQSYTVVTHPLAGTGGTTEIVSWAHGRPYARRPRTQLLRRHPESLWALFYEVSEVRGQGCWQQAPTKTILRLYN